MPDSPTIGHSLQPPKIGFLQSLIGDERAIAVSPNDLCKLVSALYWACEAAAHHKLSRAHCAEDCADKEAAVKCGIPVEVLVRQCMPHTLCLLLAKGRQRGHVTVSLKQASCHSAEHSKEQACTASEIHCASVCTCIRLLSFQVVRPCRTTTMNFSAVKGSSRSVKRCVLPWKLGSLVPVWKGDLGAGMVAV